MVCLVVATISFEQPMYIVDEADGRVEPVLVLSNPSSSVITVQVFSTNGSATGKHLTISYVTGFAKRVLYVQL